MTQLNRTTTAPHALVYTAGMAVALVVFALTGDTSWGYLAGLGPSFVVFEGR